MSFEIIEIIRTIETLKIKEKIRVKMYSNFTNYSEEKIIFLKYLIL